MVIALTGMVCADQGVPAVPGHLGITSQTVRVVDGMVMEQYSLAWQISNQSLAGRTDDPMPGTDQVQYTTTYDATIISQGGLTSLVKDMSVNTDNRLIGQSNVKSGTAVTFAATRNGGNIMGEETMMLDGTGNTTTASDRILCPFGSTARSVIPPYCNIVKVGSKYDLTVGSVAYTADERFVGLDASTPVVMNYNINVKPYGTSQGQVPASGSAMAYIKAHLQEGRGWNATRAEDLTYSETTSASGRISSFTNEISYTSQIMSTAERDSPPVVMHTITPMGGGINPSSPVTVPHGGSATFICTYTEVGFIPQWSVDGIPGQIGGSFTFTNVITDHTIGVAAANGP